MKKILLIVLLASAFFVNAQTLTPILEPTTPIEEYLIVDSPEGEGVAQVIDGDVNTKFLDFEEEDGAGFIVTLGGGARAAIAIDITTANDSELRDPTVVEIAGSNDGVTFTSVATIPVECIVERFETRRLEFSNDVAYSSYRIDFIQECDDAEGIIQVSEFQLFEAELGVENSQLASQIVITPNPNTGVFSLTNIVQLDIQTVTIYDVSGKLIHTISKDFLENEIQLTDVSAGVYFVKIQTNTEIATKKIVVQ